MPSTASATARAALRGLRDFLAFSLVVAVGLAAIGFASLV